MDTVSTDNIAQGPSAVTSRIEEAGARLLDAAKASYAFDTPLQGVVDPTPRGGPLLRLKGAEPGRVVRHLSSPGASLGFRPLQGGSGQGPAPSQSFSLAADLPRPHLIRSLRAIHDESRQRLDRGEPYSLAIAFGFLHWTGEDNGLAQPRRSPLLLLPVRLSEDGDGEFQLDGAGRPAFGNATLAHVLRKEHWIELPEWHGEMSATDYQERVHKAIGDRSGWSLDTESAVLACFDQSAFQHHLDLDPASWRHGSAPADHEVVRNLLGGLFYTSPVQDLAPLELEDSPFDPSPFEGFAGPGVADHLLDNQIPGHVLDADGHQALGIEEARLGLDLILSGPRGSGRTQTVANVVAGAVRDGQRVLVVSQRAQDLNDLVARLAESDLGSLVLRLYGKRSTREAVLRSVGETLNQPDPPTAPAGDTIQRLRSTQRRLNAHAQQMHYPHSFAGISAYEIAGWMARLSARGRDPLDVVMGYAREWDKAFLSNVTDHLARLAGHVAAMGSPRVHPWRGVGVPRGTDDGEGRDRPCPEEVRRLVAQVHEQLSDWERRVRRLAAQLCVRTRGIGDVAYMAAMAGQILKAPDVDRKAIRSPVWRRRRGEIETLVRNGQRLEDARDQVDPVLISAAWKEDLSDVRQALKAHGDSVLRWTASAYRQARARLKGLAQNEVPSSTTEQVRLLDTLDRGQEALRQIEERDELGREAFGRYWRGADSEWAHLSSIIHWTAEAVSPLSDDLPGALARAVDPKGLARLAADAESGTESILTGLTELLDVLDVDLPSAFGAESLEQVPLAALKERLDDWARRPEAHQEWTTYLAWDQEARALGLGPFADRLADGSLNPDHAVDVFHQTYLQELTSQLYSELPDLAGFDAETHEALQFMFLELDTGLIVQNRRRTRAVHRAGMPVRSDVGEMGILLSQMAALAPSQDTGERPMAASGTDGEEGSPAAEALELYELLRQAGRAVQAVKPVFLMSPATVTEFLEPGHLSFDLVVLESADILPADHALGTIARGRQVVVVGSDREGTEADASSILELCRARGMAERALPVEYDAVPTTAVAGATRAPRDASPDRTFEEVVAKALTRSGYDVDHGVGTDEIGVALAVRDPDDPGRYVLGVLTDGSTYHQAPSARQRERLVPEALHRQGWHLHRVWALDWLRDPQAAQTRLLRAVERALQDRDLSSESARYGSVRGDTGSGQSSQGEPGADRSRPETTAVRHWRGQILALFASAEGGSGEATPVSSDPSSPDSSPWDDTSGADAGLPAMEGPPYAEADFRVHLDCAPDQAPATELLSVVTRIVDTEGPIHVDEVTRRLARVWGLDRVGSRTQEAARWALQQAERDGELQREGRFVWSSRGLNFRPRSRRSVHSDTLRKARMIPPLEIRLALGQIVEGHVGLRPTEASELLTRVLGFDRLGEELKEAFTRQIQKMVDAEELQLRDGKLYVA